MYLQTPPPKKKKKKNYLIEEIQTFKAVLICVPQ